MTLSFFKFTLPYFFILSLATGCSSSEDAKQTTTIQPTNAVNGDSVLLQSTSTVKEEENDCVFDTSTFKFTTEVLYKFNPDLKFKWDDKEKQAIVPFENGDTLFLHIGGCNHFGYSAVYKTDASRFEEEDYLLEKTIWLVQHFFDNGFDTGYSKFITNHNYTLEKSKGRVFYAIDTDSTVAENEIYDGFVFSKEGNRTVISIDGYVN